MRYSEFDRPVNDNQRGDYDNRQANPLPAAKAPIRFSTLRAQHLTRDILITCQERLDALGTVNRDDAALHYVVGAFTALRLASDPATADVARAVLNRIHDGGEPAVRRILAEVNGSVTTSSLAA